MGSAFVIMCQATVGMSSLKCVMNCTINAAVVTWTTVDDVDGWNPAPVDR